MYVMVYTTCESKSNAVKMAKILVEGKLVACVNYFPVNSVYTWKGRTETAEEYVLLCKTQKKNIKKIEKRIKEMHSYECPAFIVFPITYGGKDYLSWISKNTS